VRMVLQNPAIPLHGYRAPHPCTALKYRSRRELRYVANSGTQA
jgi:hypothetical protein